LEVLQSSLARNSLNDAQWAATVKRPAATIGRRGSPLEALGAEVRQPHAPIAPAPARVLQLAALSPGVARATPAPGSKSEGANQHGEQSRPHQQHRAERTDPHHED
jgi:hypothetical protein